MEERYYSKSQLREMGWTSRAIAIFAPQPCCRVPNPKFPNAAPMCLYRESRIAAIEQTEAFRNWQASQAPRKSPEPQAAIAWAERLIIRVPQIRWDLLIELACDRHNQKQFPWNHLTKKSAPEKLERAMVAYLRSQLPDYDYLIEQTYPAVPERAYEVISERVYRAIARAYPSLEAECLRQMGDRGLVEVEEKQLELAI